MFFHLRVFLHSAFFFLILEIILRESVADFLVALFRENLYLFFSLVFLFAFVIAISAFKLGKRWEMLPIPIVLTLSSINLLAFINSPKQKFIFILLASTVYYFCLLGLYRFRLYQKDQTACGMISATTIAAIFLFYSSVYGVYLNFSISLWIIMLLFLFVTTLVSYQYFQLIEPNKKKVWLYSLVMALAMAEISWMLSFWPFGYLTTGVTMLIFYYILWDLAHSYFLKIMSKRRVVANVVFFGILATIVLISSRWLPVV